MPEGVNLLFVPLTAANLEPWREWINDPEIGALLDRNMQYVTSEEHEAFYRRAVLQNDAAAWFAVVRKADGRYVGNAWLWDINRRHCKAELRILIGDRSAWGRGIGTEAIDMLTRYGHDELKLHKIYAYVMERNPRAKIAFERAGYALEASLRDEAFWEGEFWPVHRLAHTDTGGAS